MDTIKALGFLAAGLLPSLSAADMPTDKPMTVQALVQDPKASDGKVIELRGFYLPDLMQVPHFYASRQDALGDKEFDAIDLIFADDSLQADISGPGPVCVVIAGAFSTYDHGHVLIGLASKYGVLHVQSAKPCTD